MITMFTTCFDFCPKETSAAMREFWNLPRPPGEYVHIGATEIDRSEYDIIEEFVRWTSIWLLSGGHDEKVRVRIVYDKRYMSRNLMATIDALLAAWYRWIGEKTWHEIQTVEEES